MARIRTIKPEFFSSSQVVRCSVNARMLFVGLWCFADDQGVHPDGPHRLKMEVFPGDSFAVDDVQRMLDELIEVNLVQSFAADGANWLGIPSWNRHQRIDKPTFKHPSPPAEFDERSTSPRPRIGKEGIQNGMDKEPPHPLKGERVRLMTRLTCNLAPRRSDPHEPTRRSPRRSIRHLFRSPNGCAFPRSSTHGGTGLTLAERSGSRSRNGPLTNN